MQTNVDIRELLLSARCSPNCLCAVDDDPRKHCECRCKGLYHGLLTQAEVSTIPRRTYPGSPYTWVLPDDLCDDEPLTNRELNILSLIKAIAEMMEDEPMGCNQARNPYDAGYQIALQNLGDIISVFICHQVGWEIASRFEIYYRKQLESARKRKHDA